MSRASQTRRELLRWVERELEQPGGPEASLEQLERLIPGEPALLRFLRLRDEHHRRSFYVKSERLWYRRFGWKVMRPLFVAAVLAAVGFSLQRAVDPALGFACFVLGAAAVYLAIQLFAHRWERQDLDKLAELEAQYRRELEELREELSRGG